MELNEINNDKGSKPLHVPAPVDPPFHIKYALLVNCREPTAGSCRSAHYGLELDGALLAHAGWLTVCRHFSIRYLQILPKLFDNLKMATTLYQLVMMTIRF